MAAAPSSFLQKACQQTMRQPASSPRDLLNGSQFRGAIWLPPDSAQQEYEVFPIEKMHRRPAYWLHLEGDSSIARAEKEELLYLLDAGNVQRVRSHAVICIALMRENANGEPLDAVYMKGKGACGDATALQSVQKHTRYMVNLYEFSLPSQQPGRSGRPTKMWLSVSLAGGIQGNCALQRKRCLLVGRCGTGPGSDGATMPPLGRTPQRTLCATMPGVGAAYWQELSRHVGMRLIGMKAPSAVVLGLSGLHLVGADAFETVGHAFYQLDGGVGGADGAGLRATMLNHRNRTREKHAREAVASHVEFTVRSLRSVFPSASTALVWRGGGPAQYSAARGWGRPEDLGVDWRLRIFTAEARRALRRLAAEGELAFLDTAPITAGWANATVDNNHYDGGVLRLTHSTEARSVREQPVSRNLLNVLLNCLVEAGASTRPKEKSGLLARVRHPAPD